MLGLKVPTESRRKSLSSFLLVPPTSHLSTLHANSEEARELGKHSQQGYRGGICRSNEKCVKPRADRIPASIPLVPHCSPSSHHSWSWLRPSPPPPSRTWLWSTYLMLPLLQTWLRSPPPLIPTFPTGRQRSVCLNLLRRLVLFHSWAGFWDVLLRSSCRRLGPLSGSSFSWNSSGHTWPYLTENTHWSN
jgi:hypothetical protein